MGWYVTNILHSRNSFSFVIQSIGAYQIPNFSIQDFIITRDGNRAIVLTVDPSYDDLKKPKRQMLICKAKTFKIYVNVSQ